MGEPAPRRLLTIRPLTLAIAGAVFAVSAIWASAATWYIVSGDDLTVELLRREARIKAHYEESVATLRARLDRVTSQKLLEQDSLEDRLAQLVGRQVELETRQAMLFGIDAGLGRDPQVAVSRDAPEATGSLAPAQPVLSQPAGARFAPVTRGKPAPIPEPSTAPKPADGLFEFRLRSSESAPARRASITAHLEAVETSLAQVEADQFMRLDRLNAELSGETARLRDVIVQTGLDPDELYAPTERGGLGGPYIPVVVDASEGPFEAMIGMLQETLLERERLSRATDALPFARPVPSGYDLTSGFGVRRDPFTRRPAMHSGVDFRTPTGTVIRAAGAGEVVIAEFHGGYGNMVEIDHGNGVTTRYAHLSAIRTKPGQHVATGEAIGAAGSTGRSTGPHLHYEVRLDDAPVDPMRFLRAGRLLADRASGADD
ncbi:MAG: M23 family metallopeptidase [Salinarimonadaceae bacterium]|nr:MAG: M23 family metallopeptidase [Salinarimonadaceae bacterium]